jgi:hypothetical protein
VYYDPTAQKCLIANRGTGGSDMSSTISDWTNNLAYVTGTYDETDRLANAVSTQKQAIAKYGRVDTNIGHSQGAVITRKLNEMGLTGEIINLNGASMFEKQANNETRIRSSGDMVSGMATLAPERKRNQTIDADSWNPLTEHSSKILDRMDPFHIFGRGSKKISFENKKHMPHPYPPKPEYTRPVDLRSLGIRGGFVDNRISIPYGPGIRRGGSLLSDIADSASPYLDRYTTAKQKAALKREAKSSIALARPFIPSGQRGVTDSVVSLIHGLGIGHDIAKSLGNAAIHGVDDSSARLTRALEGSGIGHDIAKSLGNAAIHGIDDSSARLTRALEGSGMGGKVNRLRKARKWEGFVADDVIPDGITAARNVNSLVQEIRNPVVSGIKDFFGFGMGGARARRAYVRKQTGPAKSNPWIAYVKAFREKHPELSYGECLKRASAERNSARGSKSAAARRHANTEYE